MDFLLAYQVLMYLNTYYFGLYSIFEFSLICAKSLDDAFKTSVSVDELVIGLTVFVFLCLVEWFRTYLAKIDESGSGDDDDNGICGINRTARIALSLFLAAPSALSVLYFLIWQRRTLRLEFVFGSMHLLLQLAQVSLGTAALLKIALRRSSVRNRHS